MSIKNCIDCDKDFETNGLRDYSMYRQDLRFEAIPLYDFCCYDCLAMRIMRNDFEIKQTAPTNSAGEK